jgi:uncharacterized protein (DUF2147 family)
MTKPILAALFLFSAAALADAPASSPVAASLGDWRTAIGAIIRIEPCGSDVCMRVVKLSPNPPETFDRHNPDQSLRNRPLCGLTIGYGFHQVDPKRLGAGRVYDPISAHTYHGYITSAGPDTLKLRGYVLFTLFGRTETWTRVTPVAACK